MTAIKSRMKYRTRYPRDLHDDGIIATATAILVRAKARPVSMYVLKVEPSSTPHVYDVTVRWFA